MRRVKDKMAKVFGIMLACSTLISIALVIWQLTYSPSDFNSKDEIGVAVIALGVL